MKTMLVASALCLVMFGSPPRAMKGSDQPSGFKVEAPLNRAGARLTVQVTEQSATSNWYYDLHVTTTDGLDQQFKIRNGQPVTPNDVRLVDVNADGFLDIMIVGGKNDRREEWFKTWVFDTKGKKFRWLDDPACGPADTGGMSPAGEQDEFKHDPLCVTIWPEKTRIKVGERLQVRLRVVNSSDSVQSFEVMSCSWDEHWKCDNLRIAHVGWSCKGNELATVRLQPGEAYERTLAMYVPAQGNSHRESFRMGFTPIGSKETYWSNAAFVALE